MMYLRYVAQEKITIGDETVNFLVIETDIDKSTTQLGLIQKIELSLDKQLGMSEPARNFLRDAWDFLKRIRIMDSDIKEVQNTMCEELLVEEFSYSLANIVQRTCLEGEGNIFNAKYDGVLVLIDEADNSSDELHLVSFFKLLLERLQRSLTPVLTTLAVSCSRTPVASSRSAVG